MNVFVATINLAQQVMVAATTPEAAKAEAFQQAKKLLACSSTPKSEWDTIEKMDDYYGINVTALELISN